MPFRWYPFYAWERHHPDTELDDDTYLEKIIWC